MLRSAGVEFVHETTAASSREARRETILAAGAIGSPQTASALRHRTRCHALGACGIAPVHDLAGVGENLHDHLQIRMQYKVKKRVDAERARQQPVGARRRWRLEYALFKHRPAHDAAVAARRVREERPVAADAEHRVARAAACRSTSSAIRCTRFPRSRRACAICGRRRAAGCASSRPIPRHYPEIKLNYLRAPEDREGRGGCACASRAGSWPRKALAKYEPEEFRPGLGVSDGRRARARRPASWARRSSIRSAPARWGTIRWRLWTTAARARRSTGLARDRRLDHAAHHVGQHERADLHDRGKRQRDDSGGQKKVGRNCRAQLKLRPTDCALPPTTCQLPTTNHHLA